MKHFTVLFLSSVLLLTSCRKEAPLVEPEIPDDPAYHVPVDSGEPMDLTLTKETRTIEANDIKGNGTYQTDCEYAIITSNRLCYQYIDMSNHMNYGEDGKYYAVFYILSAIHAYDPEDTSAFDEMAEDMLNSSVREGFTNSNVLQTKHLYESGDMDRMVYRFFDGATEENGYTPDKPLTLIMRESDYPAERRTEGGKEIWLNYLYILIPETGQEISITVYQDPLDGYWRIYTGYTNLLNDPK